MKYRMRDVATLALVGAVVACAAFSEPPAPQPLAGRYVLRTIGGVALPVAVAGAPSALYVAGSVELRADGSCVDVIQINAVVDSVTGRYNVDGTVVSVTPEGWTPYVLRWDARGTLTATWAEGNYVYQRAP